MSTTTTIPMRTLGELASAAPYILGFTPEKSILIVTLEKNGNEFERGLGMRIDIPETMQDLDEALAGFRNALARNNVNDHQAVIMCVDDLIPDGVSDMPHREYIDRVLNVLAAENLSVIATIYTDGVSVGSYDSPAFTSISAHERDYVAAHYVYAGIAPLESRDAYVEAITYTENLAVESTIKDHTARYSKDQLPLDEVIPTAESIMLTLTHYQPPGSNDISQISAALHNVKVRDVVLHDLSGVDQATGHVVNANLRVIAANTPDAFVAPVATTLAINEWLAGNGAKANMALDRALGSVSGYSLAQLIHAALENGFPPQWWQQEIVQLTRAECATGVTPETPHVELTNAPQPVTRAHDIAL